jgi:hypothetical protein
MGCGHLRLGVPMRVTLSVGTVVDMNAAHARAPAQAFFNAVGAVAVAGWAFLSQGYGKCNGLDRHARILDPRKMSVDKRQARKIT